MSNLTKINQWFEGNIERIQDNCPSVKMNEQLCDAMQVVSQEPKLQQCTPQSVVGAIITASRFGISLDKNKKQAYLIPYGKECQLNISYIGMIDVVRQITGSIIRAEAVREDDEYESISGSNPHIVHKKKPFSQAPIIGFYAIVKINNIDYFEEMNLEEIEKCRNASRGGKNTVWKTWYSEMARKSVIRRLVKKLPLNADSQVSNITSFDERQEIGEDTSEFYDIEGVEIPQEQTASEQLKELI